MPEKYLNYLIGIITVFIGIFCNATNAQGREKGIYISQYSMENTQFITNIIPRAKEVGITTFVVDYTRPSARYRQNIELLAKNGIKYVARIVVFPDGGHHQQIISESYWESRYALAKQAIDLGAKEIQLDYIRYKPSQPPSNANGDRIYEVIKWFKNKLDPLGIPLQIDVFGIAVYGESFSIGHDLVLFAPLVDAMCPMVYPSHFEPYRYHSAHPYETILNSINALRALFNGKIPFKVYPYIEMTNYRYWHPESELMNYIYAQIKATQDGGSDGWYAWSPNNKYNNLFKAMKTYPIT